MKLKDIIKESVNFAADQINPDDSFKEILTMCSYAQRMFYQYVQKNKPFFMKYLKDRGENQYSHINFEPDGNDYDKSTGTINVYANGIINDKFKNDFNESLEYAVNKLKEKVEVGPLTTEGEKTSYDKPRSKYDDTGSFEKASVIRIPILKNEVEKSKFVEMNLANSNARTLLNILDLDAEELMGTIKHKDIPRLLMKIRNLKSGKIEDNTRDASTTSSTRVNNGAIERGATIHNMGLGIEQIQHYLDRFVQILQQALDAKLDVNYA